MVSMDLDTAIGIIRELNEIAFAPEIARGQQEAFRDRVREITLRPQEFAELEEALEVLGWRPARTDEPNPQLDWGALYTVRRLG